MILIFPSPKAHHLPKDILFKEDLTVCGLFDGISCGQQALKELRSSAFTSNENS
jgi:hypothetical protein